MRFNKAKLLLILCEQGARQNVAEEQNNPDDFVGFNPPGDDAFGEVAGIRLQRFEGPGLQRLNVVIVNGRGLRENFILAHRRQ